MSKKGSKNGPELDSGVYDMWSKPPTGRVLVVEPDPDIARMLEVRLAREGHEVIVTAAGRHAIEVAAEEDIDVALIDRVLDQSFGGQELLKTLLAEHSPFEAILMTVDPTVDIFVEALEARAFDVVVKPFSNLKLVTAKVALAVAKVRAERDRNELARMLHDQTKDMVDREAKAELGDEEDLNDAGVSSIDFNGMAGTDPLTGLPNRRACKDHFRKETARALRYDRPLTIALASVDDLDAVVERHGSEVADGVLRGIVSLFGAMIRDVDFVAHRGGGEFFFIFPETPKENGFIVVERIRVKIAQTSFADFVDEAHEGAFRLSVSFGLAGLPTDTMNGELLESAAEAALTRAKTSGNRVVSFEPSMAARRI